MVGFTVVWGWKANFLMTRSDSRLRGLIHTEKHTHRDTHTHIHACINTSYIHTYIHTCIHTLVALKEGQGGYSPCETEHGGAYPP